MQRIQLADSSSYQALDSGWKQHLTWLHNDYFYHRHNRLWSENALRTLPVLMGATNMLVCGEDLGMIPSCVPPVLQQLGLIVMLLSEVSLAAWLLPHDLRCLQQVPFMRNVPFCQLSNLQLF